jgi:undecaprenyl-diphosphatase
MIDTITAVIYGLIQGLTEFLPISSSGHLALLPKLFGKEDPGIIFDLAMHVGTGLAVLLYFFKDLKKMALSLLKPNSDKKTFFFSLNMIISTLSSILLIFVIKDLAAEYGRQMSWIVFNLAFFGILMVVVDAKCINVERSLMSLNKQWTRAILIGISQAIAVFPGVSRSGITLTMARAAGLSRLESTRFSFLLSLPIIFGGFIYKLKDVQSQTAFQLDMLLLGIVISFVIGLLTIHYFLKYVSQFGLKYFGVYRVLTAIALYFVFLK